MVFTSPTRRHLPGRAVGTTNRIGQARCGGSGNRLPEWPAAAARVPLRLRMRGKDAMGFFNSIISLTSARQLNECAQIIAQKSYPHVWRRVKHRVLAMTPAEARGNIRAPSAETIRAD